MTRTTTAAPAPRNGRNGKVRTIKVAPEALVDVALAAPTLELPEHLRAALQIAQKSQQRQIRKAPTPRVAMAAAELATLERMGWKAPLITADLTVTPKPAKRGRNACKGGAAYDAAAAILTAGQSLKITELAALWLAAGGDAKPMNAILQQISNRAARTLQQNGATIAAV